MVEDDALEQLRALAFAANDAMSAYEYIECDLFNLSRRADDVSKLLAIGLSPETTALLRDVKRLLVGLDQAGEELKARQEAASAAYIERKYGIKFGQIIEITYRGGKTFKMRADNFSFYDFRGDDTCIVCGKRIRKDGSVGVRGEMVYLGAHMAYRIVADG